MSTSTTRTLMEVLGRGWAFPVVHRPGGDAPAFEASADEQSVREAIQIILSTRKGERVMRPDFGCNLDHLLFAPNNGATQAAAEFEVREALLAWEPRIELLDVKASAAGPRGEVLAIEVGYRVRSTDNRYNLVYPFYLDRALA